MFQLIKKKCLYLIVCPLGGADEFILLLSNVPLMHYLGGNSFKNVSDYLSENVTVFSFIKYQHQP